MSLQKRPSPDPVDREGRNIRLANKHDARGIARIYNHYVDVGGATFDTDHWHAERIIRLIQLARPDGWFVATQRKRLLGWASARLYSQRHGYRHTCETAIYVEVDAIGSGVADDLQHRVDDHCRQCDLHHAVARIIADNQRSIAFHQRHGYTLVGVQKEIGFLNGKWVDVAIMQKLF